MYASTKNCVICFKKATCFGGHVHKGEHKIIAGLCDEHFKTPKCNNGCKGCYGKYDPLMEVDESFGSLMYIDKAGLHEIKE